MSCSLNFKVVAKSLLTTLIILSFITHAILPTVIFAQELSSTDDSETTITTGDAVAGVNVETEVNTVEMVTDKNAEEAAQSATSTETESLVNEETSDDTDTNGSDNEYQNTTEDNSESASTTVTENDQTSLDPFGTGTTTDNNPDTDMASTTNTATTSTSATSSATTGSNLASGDVVNINTGDAIAYADVLNVVNTNIVNSDGLVSFINNTLGYETFDLRPSFEIVYPTSSTAVTTSPCVPDACPTDTLYLYNASNTAEIYNDVTVIADTGNNTASGTVANINTGNAYASANIINVANTNIVDSQYLLLVFNNFNDFAGNIVLPGSSFFDQYLTNTDGINTTNTSLSNQADVENSTVVVADTGHNSASGEGSIIDTGSATAVSDTTDLVNQTIAGGTVFSMLIRVHGDWTGSISGLPDGMSWRETDRGIEIINTRNNLGLPLTTGSTGISNNATIRNNVQAYALTGDNYTEGENTTTETGNAYAGSSIMNIVNTNVIGSNWSQLILNIYGNWHGDLTFGQPDLWIGVTANSPDQPIMPDSLVTYTFTVFNHGDTTAPDVQLESVFENNALSFSDGMPQPAGTNSTSQHWSLGDIKAGETKEFTHVARVNEHLDGGVVSAIPLVSRVTSSVQDANESDNEEIVTIYAGKKRNSSNSKRISFPANFEITKTASHDLIQPGDTVDYTVTFFNRGGPLFDALLIDTLRDEEGEIVQEQTWPLYEIKNWETITINYSIEFDSTLPVGVYTNSAQLVGFHESRLERHQTPYESSIASHELQVGTLPEGLVLGIQDSSCEPYLTNYLRYGVNNDSTEVKKLQMFLNQQLSRSLTSGIFDRATEQAVRDFQIIHRDEILTPWGLTRDSGYVYYTTQKKINEIMCQGTSFPLSPTQVAEVNTYRTTIQEQQEFSFTHTEQTPTIPPTREIVQAVITPPPRELESQSETYVVPPPVMQPTETDSSNTRNWWGGLRGWWQRLTQ